MSTIETGLILPKIVEAHPNQRFSVDNKYVMKILDSRDWRVTSELIRRQGRSVSLAAIDRQFRAEGQEPYSQSELDRLEEMCTPSSKHTSFISHDGDPPDVHLWITARVKVTCRPAPIPDIVVAHREGIARQGISKLIEQGSKVKVVGTAGNYDDLPEVLVHTRPDVLLTTTDLPSEQKFSPSSQLEKIARELRIVVIAPTYEDPMMGVLALSSMAHSVSSFVHNEDYQELVQGILEAHLGRRYVSSRLLGENSLNTKEQFYDLLHPFKDGRIFGFSPRELQVVVLLGRGLTNKDVAIRLDISEKTVETHRRHILDKAAKVRALKLHPLTFMTSLAFGLELMRREDLGSG